MKYYKITFYIAISLVFLTICNVFFNKYKRLLREIGTLEKKIINHDKVYSEQQWKVVKELIFKDKILKKNLYDNFSKNAEREKIKILTKDFFIEKYKLIFVPRSVEIGPGQVINLKNTGYIDIHNNDYLYINGDGSLITFKIEDQVISTDYIDTNLSEIIKDFNFYSLSTIGIKDMRIFDDKIYLTYLRNFNKDLNNDCYNLAVLESNSLKKINFSDEKIKINFDIIFQFEEKCAPVLLNNTNQNGGRLEKINDDFYLTVGDFRVPGIAQKEEYNFGKIVKFTKNSKNEYKIISKGHRNQQGLFYDEDRKYLLSTEHGPNGGDEINLIDTSLDNEIQNFGWDISSYGVHYSGEKHLPKLKKSHSDFGFIEPLKYFVPSIAIQDLKKIQINNSSLYVLSALGGNPEEGDLSLHFFDLVDKKYIAKDIVNINQRIRDLAYDKNKNKLLLVLENPTTIASINLK